MIIKAKEKKISEVLLRLIKPYNYLLDEGSTEQRLTSLLAVGSIAWNYSITQDEDMKKPFLDIISNPKGLSEMKVMLEKLVARKERLFPNDDRIIVDYKINSIEEKRYDITVSFVYKNEYFNSK